MRSLVACFTRLVKGPRIGIGQQNCITVLLVGRFEPRQLTLDETSRAKGERLGDALDEICAKFGTGSISRAVD